MMSRLLTRTEWETDEDLQELWSVQIYCISAGLFHVWYYLVNRQKKSSRAWSRSRYITFTWGPVLTRSFCDLRMFCVHVAHRPAGECLIPADTLSHLQVDFRRAAQTGEGSPASDIIDYSEIKSPSCLLSHSQLVNSLTAISFKLELLILIKTEWHCSGLTSWSSDESGVVPAVSFLQMKHFSGRDSDSAEGMSDVSVAFSSPAESSNHPPLRLGSNLQRKQKLTWSDPTGTDSSDTWRRLTWLQV